MLIPPHTRYTEMSWTLVQKVRLATNIPGQSTEGLKTGDGVTDDTAAIK